MTCAELRAPAPSGRDWEGHELTAAPESSRKRIVIAMREVIISSDIPVGWDKGWCEELERECRLPQCSIDYCEAIGGQPFCAEIGLSRVAICHAWMKGCWPISDSTESSEVETPR